MVTMVGVLYVKEYCIFYRDLLYTYYVQENVRKYGENRIKNGYNALKRMYYFVL